MMLYQIKLALLLDCSNVLFNTYSMSLSLCNSKTTMVFRLFAPLFTIAASPYHLLTSSLPIVFLLFLKITHSYLNSFSTQTRTVFPVLVVRAIIFVIKISFTIYRYLQMNCIFCTISYSVPKIMDEAVYTLMAISY